MNKYNIKWCESDFHKKQFHDATEFFDMLNIKSRVVPVVPLRPSDILSNIISREIIGSYDFDRKTNKNAYIIQKVQSSYITHYRLIQAERTYSNWNIGGILTSFHIIIFEARTLNDLVIQVLPDEILEFIYQDKFAMRSQKKKYYNKIILSEYGQQLFKTIF